MTHPLGSALLYTHIISGGVSWELELYLEDPEVLPEDSRIVAKLTRLDYSTGLSRVFQGSLKPGKTVLEVALYLFNGGQFEELFNLFVEN